MTIVDKLDSELIFISEQSTERENLFIRVNRVLSSKGVVSDGYLDALIARENDHPTAMLLETMGVAIPHVTPELVLKERLAIVTSNDGFIFKSAEDDSIEIKVNVIFFLLLNDRDQHLRFLMQLFGLFSQTKKMEELLFAKSSQEVITLLSAAFKV